MRRQAPRILALAALGGQLAAVADALFVEHVTCPEHGDRIHVTAHGRPPVARSWDGVGTAIAGFADQHDQCLLDEDGNQAPAAPTPTLGAPAVTQTSTFRLDLGSPAVRRAPLYRLAPKNSPPEKSRPIV